MKKSKRVLSLVLAMLMLFSVFSVAISAKEVEVAETSVTMTGGEVLYLKPNSNWTQDGARFAAYFFGTGEKWISMEACPRDSGYYKVTVPSGSWTNVIFCRMNPSSTTNDWNNNNKWNQSSDLVYDGTNNLYTVQEGSWDKGGGAWSVFTETPEPTEAPTDEPTEAPTDEPTEAPTDEPTEAPTEEPTEAPTLPGETKTVYVGVIKYISYVPTLHYWNNAGLSGDAELVSLNEVKQYSVGDSYWSNAAKNFNIYKAEIPVEATSYKTFNASNNSNWADETITYAEDTITLVFEYSNVYHNVTAEYVVDEPTEAPTDEPTEAPTEEPTEAPTDEPTDAPTDEPTEAPTDEPTEAPTDEPTEAPTDEPTEAPTDEPTEAPTDEPTEAPTDAPVAEAGYYLVGTLNGVDCWFVDGTAADRMLAENAGAQGEYMLDYTFVEGDSIKVVYFDGYEIKTWYKDGMGNDYDITAELAGDATIYFRPDGNADWGYTYFTVIVTEAPTEEPTEAPTDEPTEAPTEEPTEAPTDEPTEAPTEEPTEPVGTITVYFQNNWMWKNVCAYWWEGGAQWPGDALEVYANDGTYDIYAVTVPADVKGIIFNGYDEGAGKDNKTPDITDAVDGNCYYMIWNEAESKNDVGMEKIDVILPEEPTEAPTDEPTEAPTDEPTEAPTDEPTEAPTEEPTEAPTEAPVKYPDKVEGVKAVAASRTSFTVSWDATEGALNYWVFVNGKCHSLVNGTSLEVTNCKVGTQYEVYVIAYFANDSITPVAKADVVTVKTDSYEYSTSYVADAYSITINWVATDATKTWIYYGTTENDVKLHASSLTDTYTITGLKTNTTYYYKLAHLIDGVIVYSDEIVEVTTTIDETLVATAARSDDGIVVDWGALDGATTYWVVAETEEGTYVYRTDDTTFTVPNVTGECIITVKAAVNDKIVNFYPVEVA